MDRKLLEACRNGASLFQPRHAVLDHVAAAVRGAVELRLAARPVRASRALVVAFRDDGAHPEAPQPCAHPLVAVALVAGERCGPATRAPRRAARNADRVEGRGDVLALVRLPRAQRDGERQAPAVSDQVQLGGEPAAAAPQRVVRRLAEAPPSSRVFPPRPRPRGGPGRSCRRCTRAASRGGPPRRGRAGAPGRCGPTAPRASNAETASTRWARGRSAPAGRATGSRWRGGTACR